MLDDLRIKTMVDVPCGDFHWMQRLLPELGLHHSLGLDIVPALIVENRAKCSALNVSFEVLDVTREVPPQADLVLMRDLLIHLSLAHAKQALANVRASGAEWLLVTTHPLIEENTDIVSGRWRSVNLRRPPYGFPPPVREIIEVERGKTLGLWRARDIPV